MSYTRTVSISVLGLTLGAFGCRERPIPEQSSTAPAPPAEQALGPADQTTSGENKVGSTEVTSADSTHAAAKGGPNMTPFEGELKVDVTGKAPESIHYAMKGDKIRLGLGEKPGSAKGGVDAIIDTGDQRAKIVLNDRKEYIDVDLAKLARGVKHRVEAMDVKKTGKMSTVAGRACEEWEIRDRDYRVSTCVMKGAPYFDLNAIEREGKFEAPPWLHRIVDTGYVPLRVTVRDAAGKSLGSSEITDTSDKVDESQFQVPAGYKRTDLSGAPRPKK